MFGKVSLDTKKNEKYEHVHALGDDAIEQINVLGLQPFILVRVPRHPDAESAWIQCPTKSEATAFAADLAKLPEFRDSKFLQAIERAICGEIYESADLLFAWCMEPDTGCNVSFQLGLPAGAKCFGYAGYPVFTLEPPSDPSSPSERADILAHALYAYTSAKDKHQLWRCLIEKLWRCFIEAFGFALSRILGEQGKYDDAMKIVEDVMRHMPYSIHLKAAKHALELKLKGTHVPDRFAKFIGKDNGYLRQFVCREPFNRLDIVYNGDVLVCCGLWLPKVIGNFLRDPLDDVLNSKAVQKIRQSVVDGTYKYCNHFDCGPMIQGNMVKRDEVDDPNILKAIREDDYRVDGAQEILFSFDPTCNLSCPSCRVERITEKASVSEAKMEAIEQKLFPILAKVKVLFLNQGGELFASKQARKILQFVNDDSCPDLELDIISNGTLFSEKEWGRFPGIHNKIRSIRISIDAATKETFEKLRRLGEYEPFLENMRFLARLREDKIIPHLKFSFTYQLDNFREMADFVRFGLGMNCDLIIFDRLQNYGAFTHSQYCELAVHRPEHPRYHEFLDVVRDPTFRQAAVWHDFDYEGVEILSRDEAMNRRARVV